MKEIYINFHEVCPSIYYHLTDMLHFFSNSIVLQTISVRLTQNVGLPSWAETQLNGLPSWAETQLNGQSAMIFVNKCNKMWYHA